MKYLHHLCNDYYIFHRYIYIDNFFDSLEHSMSYNKAYYVYIHSHHNSLNMYWQINYSHQTPYLHSIYMDFHNCPFAHHNIPILKYMVQFYSININLDESVRDNNHILYPTNHQNHQRKEILQVYSIRRNFLYRFAIGISCI